MELQFRGGIEWVADQPSSVTAAGIVDAPPAADVMASTAHDHRALVLRGGWPIPPLARVLGYMVVGRWLETVPEVDGVALINVAAADVLSAWSNECATTVSGYADCPGA